METFGISNISVVSDTGWTHDKLSSIPRRGINDYNRVIVFGRELSIEELPILRKWLAENNCPGWTGVWIQPLKVDSGFQYSCRTTWDSSD